MKTPSVIYSETQQNLNTLIQIYNNFYEQALSKKTQKKLCSCSCNFHMHLFQNECTTYFIWRSFVVLNTLYFAVLTYDVRLSTCISKMLHFVNWHDMSNVLPRNFVLRYDISYMYLEATLVTYSFKVIVNENSLSLSIYTSNNLITSN